MLRTLGGLELPSSSFARPKPLLLLCYLALEGTKERRHLAELFWQDATDPLNRLAVTLTRLRKADAGLIGANKSQAWTELATDVQALLSAMERSDFEEVIKLYGGPFLQGVHFEDWGAELSEWVYSTRDFLAAQVKTAQLSLAETEAAKGDFKGAAERAAAAYSVVQTAGLEPEDIRRTHALLLAGGHPQATALKEEAKVFDLELVADQDQARSHLGFTPGLATNLAKRTSRFVGRELELGQLAELIDTPQVRLISVLGGGGIGKTSLASEAARRYLAQERFTGGVYFVALDALIDSAAIPTKLAEALGLNLEGAKLPLEQIAAHFGAKPSLVVLDNFEQLLDGATLLTDLLQACSELTLVVTTRERLNLKEEWLFPLKGLTFSSHIPLEDLQFYDAPQLFIERAKQLQPGFTLSPDVASAVQTICQLVEGSPLGLELAATLVRVMPVAEIAKELGRDLDVLSVPSRDLAERHRSLRTVFDYSWRLLTPVEQETLRRLAVFRGGFIRAAAAEVAGATIPLLLSLVDKSLLRVTESGRYDRHPLVYSYTREKLAEQPEELAEVSAKHAVYFSQFSDGLRVKFNGPYPKETYGQLELEIENCRAAWRWAVDERNASIMLGFANAFWFYYGNVSENSRAISYWEEADDVLDENNPAHREALGVFVALQSQFFRGAKMTKGKVLAERGLKLLQGSEENLAKAICLATLSLAAETEGRLEEAISLNLQSGDVTPPDLTGEMPLYVAHLEMKQGNYGSAKARLLAALDANREAQFTRSIVGSLATLGDVYFFEEDYETARHYYQEGMTFAREHSFRPGGRPETECPFGLSELELKQGNLAEASKLVEEAMADYDRLGLRQVETALTLLGRVATAQGDYEQATTELGRALRVRIDMTSELPITRLSSLSGVVLAFTELWIKQGHYEKAAPVLGFLHKHLHAAYNRVTVEAFLATVQAGLSAKKLKTLVSKGETLTLKNVLQGFWKDASSDASPIDARALD